MITNVVIIGAGNLATQLALVLHNKSITVKQIFSRNIENARDLAQRVNSAFTNNLSDVLPDADIYFIAVKDSAIQDVVMNLPFNNNQFIVHTAGSVNMNIFEEFSTNYGVFYPFQTFTKSRVIDFSEIPICIEANHPSNLMKLQRLASVLSNSVNQISSDERKTLHISAVFANNFVNHLYTISSEILHDKNLSFDLIKPLIAETAEKIRTINPVDAQTGPAQRNDKTITEKHLNELKNNPDIQKIYSFITDSIFRYHNKKNS